MNSRRLCGVAIAMLFLCAACGGPGEIRRVIVVTFDTTRAERLGCYGYEQAETPHLDRFAEQSVLFEQALSPVPTTLPSHSTMFTGLYPQDHGVRYNLMYTLGPEARTLAEILNEAGFATAGFPATFILAEKFGLDQGFDTYAKPPRRGDEGVSHRKAVMRPAEEGVDLVLDWLAEPRDRAFVWLHFYDPHWPYTPPFPYSSRFRDEPYDGEIAYADAQFGRLLDALQADPEWSRTLLIVAGDHGEGLYDHGERFHSNLVYQTTQHVPLIIRAPGAGARRVAEPVGIVDLTPTVLDLVGLPPLKKQRGRSLRAALGGATPQRRDLYFESHAGTLSYGWAELHGLRYGRWKLIDSTDPELFDLEQDPREEANLAAVEPERVQELQAALTELRPSILEESQAIEAMEALLDPQTEAFLASLGYVGSLSSGSAENAPLARELIDLEAELLRAQGAVTTQNHLQTETVCRYVLSRDPTNKWALQNLATALIELERPAEAQDVAAELLRVYPNNPQAYTLLARAYSAQDEPQIAFEVLQQGVGVLPRSAPLAYLSVVAAFEARHPEVCTASVPALLNRFPTFTATLILQARCEIGDGRIDDALSTLRTAADRGFARFELLRDVEEFEALVQDDRFLEFLESEEETTDAPESS